MTRRAVFVVAAIAIALFAVWILSPPTTVTHEDYLATHDCYRFDPKPDITAFELALILKAVRLQGWSFGDKIYTPKAFHLDERYSRNLSACGEGEGK